MQSETPVELVTTAVLVDVAGVWVMSVVTVKDEAVGVTVAVE